MSECTEGLRDRLARALFMEGVGADSAAAWDAPGDGGRQRWWNYADAVLAEIAEHDRKVAEKAWDEGAQWAAVECGAIDEERQVWLAPGDNPYTKGEQK